MDSKGLIDAIRKSVGVGTTAGAGGDFLPEPLANMFIGYVREQNFCRQLFTVVPMSGKTRDMPKILSGNKAYYQSTEGNDATSALNGVSTGTIRLEAKKFMSEVVLSSEVIEDAEQDIESIVQTHFAGALAGAEEQTMLVGDTGHSPTTATEANANASTWYTKDNRLAFDGLLTLAGDITGAIGSGNRAANRVNAGDNEMSAVYIREAIHNLSVWGRNMKDQVAILNPWAINTLMDDAALMTVDKYGPNATILTGEFGKLYGQVSVINSGYMTDTYGIVLPKANVIIGERRKIKIVRDNLPRNDAIVIVITERIDMTIQYHEALCQIYGIEAASSAS